MAADINIPFLTKTNLIYDIRKKNYCKKNKNKRKQNESGKIKKAVSVYTSHQTHTHSGGYIYKFSLKNEFFPVSMADSLLSSNKDA